MSASNHFLCHPRERLRIFLACVVDVMILLWEASGQLLHVLQGEGGRFRCLEPRWDPPGQRRPPWECPALVGWTRYVNNTYLSLPGGEWLTYIPQALLHRLERCRKAGGDEV